MEGEGDRTSAAGTGRAAEVGIRGRLRLWSAVRDARLGWAVSGVGGRGLAAVGVRVGVGVRWAGLRAVRGRAGADARRGRGKRRRGTETNPGWSYASGTALLLAVVAPENERDGVDGDEPGEEGEFAG